MATRLDATFHALANPARRQMLGLLAAGDATAGELGRPLSMSQPAASKHIRILEDAGLVSRRIDGRVHRLRLQPKALELAEGWIARHQRLWERSLDSLGEHLEEQDAGDGA